MTIYINFIIISYNKSTKRKKTEYTDNENVIVILYK